MACTACEERRRKLAALAQSIRDRLTAIREARAK